MTAEFIILLAPSNAMRPSAFSHVGASPLQFAFVDTDAQHNELHNDHGSIDDDTEVEGSQAHQVGVHPKHYIREKVNSNARESWR